MKIDHNKIQLGSDPDPTKNFIIQTPPVQDGTLEIRRGTLDAPGALVATFNEHGLVDPRELVNVTASRSKGGTYTNNTSIPIVVYVQGSFTAGSDTEAYMDGRRVFFLRNNAGGLDPFVMEFTVPPGKTYSVTDKGQTINGWYEYRLPEGA